MEHKNIKFLNVESSMINIPVFKKIQSKDFKCIGQLSKLQHNTLRVGVFLRLKYLIINFTIFHTMYNVFKHFIYYIFIPRIVFRYR